MGAMHLDPDVIDSLRQLTAPGEPDVLREVLELFLAEVPKRMTRLRNAMVSRDIQEVQRSAHSLKGSAGNVGALALYDICDQLDAAAKRGDADAVAPLVDAMGTEFGNVEAEIHRLIGA